MHPILDPGSRTFWRRVEETRALQLAFVFYLQRHLPSLARLRQVLAVHFLKLFSCHHPFVDGNTCRYSSFCLAQYRTPQMVGCFQVDFISSHPSLLVSNFFFVQGCVRTHFYSRDVCDTTVGSHCTAGVINIASGDSGFY